VTDALHAAMLRLANIVTDTNRKLDTVTRVLKQIESRVQNIERIVTANKEGEHDDDNYIENPRG